MSAGKSKAAASRYPSLISFILPPSTMRVSLSSGGFPGIASKRPAWIMDTNAGAETAAWEAPDIISMRVPAVSSRTNRLENLGSIVSARIIVAPARIHVVRMNPSDARYGGTVHDHPASNGCKKYYDHVII